MPIATDQSNDDQDIHLLDRTGALPSLSHFKVPDIPPAAFYIPDFITPAEEAYLLRKYQIAESPTPNWKTVGSGRRLQYWGGNLSKNGVLLPEPLPEFLRSSPDILERIESYLQLASPSSSQTGSENNEYPHINQVLVNEYQAGQGISPHEDGPAFRPIVATLSLGSYTILDIHHYLSTTSPSPPMTTSEAMAEEADSLYGRPIAAIPLAHLLVLPRSLLILSSSLYTAHLHGITAAEVDTVTSTPSPGAVHIANAALLGDAEIIDKLRNEGSWRGQRETRTSLTFRHAQKVLKGGVFSMVRGGLHRT